MGGVSQDRSNDDAPSLQSVGAFRILRRIGRGGMGEVYEAEQDTPRRRVALKIVRLEPWSPELVRRFRLEAEVLGRLNHPCVAHVYEAGTAAFASVTRSGREMPYIAMELVEGRSLVEHAQAAALSTRARLELFARVCDGVHHAHQKGVIHRDLKPHNVLVADGVPKIVDWGVARLVDPHAATLTTHAGTIVGTIAYMSPEQARGHADEVDVRSDVYSLGVMMCELLTGKLPYRPSEPGPSALLQAILHEESIPLAALDPRLGGDVEAIARMALEKDKERRYASAAEFAADVRRHLRDEPIQARRPSAVDHVAKFARRNRALVSASVLAAISLVVGSAVAGWKAVEASEQRALAEERATEAAAARDEAKAVSDFLMLDVIESTAPSRGGHDVRVVDVLDGAFEQIDARFADAPNIAGAVYDRMARMYIRLGQAERALESARKAREDFVRSSGPNDARTFTAENLILEALAELGRWDECAEAARATYERALSTFGPSNEQAVAARLAYADALQVLGRHGEAEPMLREMLEVQRAGGPRHLGDLHHVLNLLGASLRAQGKADEAEEILREEVEVSRRLFERRDIGLFASLNNYAMFLDDRGRVEEALPVAREAYDVALEVFPTDHTYLASAAWNLSSVLMASGREGEAWEPARRAMEVHTANLGPSDPRTLSACARWAASLAIAGRADEARAAADDFERRRASYSGSRELIETSELRARIEAALAAR